MTVLFAVNLVLSFFWYITVNSMVKKEIEQRKTDLSESELSIGIVTKFKYFQENSINTIFILGQLCNCYLSEWNMHRSTKMFVCFVFVILEGNFVLRMLTNFSAIYKHVILVLQNCSVFFLAVRKRRLLLKK